MSITEEQRKEFENLVSLAAWPMAPHTLSQRLSLLFPALGKAIETLLRENALANRRIEKLRLRLHTIMATSTDGADAGLAEAALTADDALAREGS